VRLSAKVRAVTGATSNLVATGPSAEPIPFPPAARVEITDTERGFFLLRLSSLGVFAGDSWHATLAEAKSQAQMEFAILEDEWREQPAAEDPR
jgi:hypothetical protein